MSLEGHCSCVEEYLNTKMYTCVISTGPGGGRPMSLNQRDRIWQLELSRDYST